jgi:trimeric autotransporter adhesin
MNLESGTQEVANVNPALVLPDKEGKPYTVRYDAVNAMLLNEFLKEHRTVNELKAMVAQQQKQLEVLTAGLQKVSAQLELNKAALQTVLNYN